MVKSLLEMPETWVQSSGQEDPLEKGMATHSSILAWKIPLTEEPDGLQSMGVTKKLDMTELLIRVLPEFRTPTPLLRTVCGFEQVALFEVSFHICKIRLKLANESHIKGCQGDSMR